MPGDPNASTMSDEALQKYIDYSELNNAHPDSPAGQTARIARSHQNVNAKLQLAEDSNRALRGRLAAAELRIARGIDVLMATSPEN